MKIAISVFFMVLAPVLWILAYILFASADFDYSMQGAGAGSDSDEWANAGKVLHRIHAIVVGIAVGGFVAAYIGLRGWVDLFYIPSKTFAAQVPNPEKHKIQPMECQNCNMVITYVNADKLCPYCNRKAGTDATSSGVDKSAEG